MIVVGRSPDEIASLGKPSEEQESRYKSDT